MSRFKDLISSRLSSRLLLLMTANVIVFLLIAASLLLSFEQIGHHIGQTTTKHLNNAFKDAVEMQRAAELLQHVDTLATMILARDDSWQRNRQKLEDELTAYVEQVEDRETQHSISAVKSALSRLAKSREAVSNLLTEIQANSAKVRWEISAIDRWINDRLTDLRRQQGEPRLLRRLLTWIGEFRVGWLNIERLQLEQHAGYLTHGVEFRGNDGTILTAVDELNSRLNLPDEAASALAEQGVDIQRSIMHYRGSILKLRDAVAELSIRLNNLQMQNGMALKRTAQHLQSAPDISAQTIEEADTILGTTKVSIISVVLIVILGNILFTAYFFRRHVRKPLRQIIKSIAEVDGIGAMVDSSTHKIEGDEWAIISYALKSMQSELSSQLAAIRNSEARYKLLVENQGDMIVKLDSEGHFQFVSPTYCDTFGKSQPELLGSVSPITLLAKGQGEQGRTMMDLYRPPYECLLEQRSLTTKGWRWFSWNHRALLDERGQVSAIIGVGRDVTDRKQAELELDRQRSFLHTVIDAVADPILVIGRDYRIKMSNSAALKSFGRDSEINPSDLNGFCYKVTHGEDAPCKDSSHPCPLHQVLQTGKAATALHLHKTVDGERTFELTANPFTDSEGRILGIVQVSRDITEKLKAEDRIRFLAHHDALTGLPNRILLRDRFIQAANYAERAGHSVAVLFLDLDHFKDVNDSLGHKVGDRLLQEVVVRLASKVRSSDTVSRLGGDEFVVVVPQAGVQGTSEQIAGHILEALSETFHIDGHNLRLSASIGISVYPADGEEFDDLLKCADTAMYSAKQAGRNTYRFYSKEMNQVNSSRLQTLSLMKQALDNEEFTLFYQPQVEMESGRIVGLEALVSWNTHKLGRLRPGQFISLAEESGLIVPIGNWVLHQACRQVSEWNRILGCSVPIAINLSALQIRQSDFTESVLAALEQSKLPAQQLDLELTESMLLQDTSQVLKTVMGLKSLGVNLIMDDFGTGYSSLSYLKKFNLSGLKIDRSFITDLIHESEDAAIVRAIIQMSRSLGLTVVAEGVESIEQVAWLKREGCERAQGYYYYKPMDAQSTVEVLKQPLTGAKHALER